MNYRFGVSRLMQELAGFRNRLVKNEEELTGADQLRVYFELLHDLKVGLKRLVEVVLFLELVVHLFGEVKLS